MSMEKITKTFEFSNVEKKEKGYSAIVSTFTVKDSHGDRIQFGAFANSLNKLKARNGSVPVLFEHSHGLTNTVGKTTFIAELEPADDRLPMNVQGVGGLYVEFEFYTDFPEGQKAEKLLLDGVYQEFSVGMYVYDYEVTNDSYDNFEAIIKEADLVEYSMVLRGANPLTGIVSMKDLTTKVGREISQSNLETLKGAIESIDGASEQLKSITSKFEQQEEKENLKAIRERLLKLKARRLKHIIERNTK